MAIKDCPIERIETALAMSRRYGQTCYVLYDNVMCSYIIVKEQTYRGLNISANQRYDIRASVNAN